MARRYLLPAYHALRKRLSIYATLTAIIIIFIILLLASLFRVEENRNIRHATESAAEWNVLQIMAQLEKFSARVESFLRSNLEDDKDVLLEQYDVLWSRFRLLLNNPENGSLQAIEAAYPTVIGIEEQLATLESVVQELHPGNVDGYHRIEAFIGQQRQWLNQLVNQVHAERVDVREQLGEVGEVYEETLLFLMLTMLSVATMVFQLFRALRKTDFSLREAETARADAQAAQRELQTVVDAVPAMIAVWDVNGRCLFANRLCSTFVGVDAGEMAGRNEVELGFESGRPHSARDVARTGGALPFFEHRSADARGDEHFLMSTLVPIWDDAGGIVSVVDVSLDITERKQREVALAEARGRLERQAGEMRTLAETAQRANEAKSVFLAMMSHEIRTPMNALLGFADLLADSPLLPDQRHYIGVVRETGRQLLALLSDILDFTRIEQGGIEVERVPFRLDEHLRSLQPVAEMLVTEKAVAFGLEVDPGLPHCVWGDPARLRQVLTNLLSNAAKFTRGGRISLVVEREPGPDPAAVRFAVIDTGIGINPARLPRLFQMFSQAEDDTHRRFGGTGLGLAICRRLVELMGGRIGVESEPGRGSTFWLVLPLEPVAETGREADAAAGGIMAPQIPAAARPPLKVLVVDDVETNLQLLQALVRRAGHQVVTAADGAESVRMIARDPPDLVLMDVNMPGMDGLEAARRVRGLGGAAGRVPIVALTANAFASDVEACREAGMDGHLVKPVDVATLAATLDRYSAAAPPPAPIALAERTTIALLDTARLDTLAEAVGVEEVNGLFRRMAREAKATATALRRAHEADDGEAMRRAAHGLAGLAGNLGAARLSELARSVELQAPGDPSGRAAHVAVATLDEIDQTRSRTTAAFEAWLAARPSERQVVNA